MEDNGKINFLDMLNIMSFVIGLMNLNENLTQGDKQDIMKNLSEKADTILKEVHSHLEEQDEKINKILEILGGNTNENN